MSDDPDDIPLETVLEAAAQSIMSRIQTSQPGIISGYDHATQRASVTPSVQRTYVGEDDADITKSQPEIHDVIILQSGSPRGRITYPIQDGDPCLLFHGCVAYDRYKLSNNSQSINPGNPRRHNLNDAVALVGIHTFGAVPTDAPNDAVVVWAADGIKILLGDKSGTRQLLTTLLLNGLGPVAGLWSLLDSIISIVEISPTGPIHVAKAALMALPGINTTVTEAK